MKKAIVIGASSGIGWELSKLLAADGYAVAIAARRKNLLYELSGELPSGTLVRQLDVTNTNESTVILTELIEEMSGVDLIVFAAGCGELNADLEWELEHMSITTNVLGFTSIANVAFRHFAGKGSGHFVAISSIAALRGGKAAPAYNASKAFMSNYLEGLQQKVASLCLPITITDVKPGFVDTDMAKGEGLFWIAPVKKAAKQIHKAIQHKKSHVYVTRRWRLIAWVLKSMPDFLYNRL